MSKRSIRCGSRLEGKEERELEGRGKVRGEAFRPICMLVYRQTMLLTNCIRLLGHIVPINVVLLSFKSSSQQGRAVNLMSYGKYLNN